jgi:hypothetical protein
MLCYQDEDKMHLPHTEDMGQVLCDDHCEIMVKQSLRMVGVFGADLLVVASDVRSGLSDQPAEGWGGCAARVHSVGRCEM